MRAYKTTNREWGRKLAYLASQDAGNQSMRRAGRTRWNEEDYQAAMDEFSLLWPEERDIQEARSRFEWQAQERERQ